MNSKTERDSVRTPKFILDWVTKHYGKQQEIMDPCPYNNNFDKTKHKDGLKIEWGKVTFCNPPYSEMRRWVLKAAQEWRKQKTIIVLVKARSLTTKYFKDSRGCIVYFFKKKFKFPSYDDLPHFHSVILVYEAGKTSNVYTFFPQP
jgi:hypothetical protein